MGTQATFGSIYESTPAVYRFSAGNGPEKDLKYSLLEINKIGIWISA